MYEVAEKSTQRESPEECQDSQQHWSELLTNARVAKPVMMWMISCYQAVVNTQRTKCRVSKDNPRYITAMRDAEVERIEHYPRLAVIFIEVVNFWLEWCGRYGPQKARRSFHLHNKGHIRMCSDYFSLCAWFSEVIAGMGIFMTRGNVTKQESRWFDSILLVKNLEIY